MNHIYCVVLQKPDTEDYSLHNSMYVMLKKSTSLSMFTEVQTMVTSKGKGVGNGLESCVWEPYEVPEMF